MPVVLPDGRSAADDGEKKEEQSRDFQPEHVQHTSDRAGSDSACVVKGAYPTVLAALSSRDP